MKGTVRWRGVELRHLEALAAVGEEGSFHRAAARLGYSQSAISQQVAALERAVGRRLMHRSGGSRTVSPTEAGRVLIEHAKAIGARLAAAEDDLSALESPAHGRLRVGLYRGAPSRVVAAALGDLQRSWPHVQVELTQSSSEVRLLRLLEGGELDLALVHLPIARGPFGFEPLPQDEYVLVLPAGGEREDLPTLAEIASLPLLGFHESRSAEGAFAYLRASGHDVQPMPVADDVLTLLRLVATGLGATLLPRLALERVDGVALIELPPELPRRSTAIAWHRDLELRPAANAFVRAVACACARVLDADSRNDCRTSAAVIAPAQPAA